ncbi:inorganic triphosphatase [Stutzerimonas kirkiae]|uniref:Inorganic triphosphatase n=1 Tax=Stutzerimonas kirkiae TaxID=2211392 RepID=A0A4Q9R2D2_9GAMM|nr:CYTH domain-containing protein [Stutzerimonas kirkiae]TBU92627.1 inorganic triphosphatase [Stutzerimonas kirkiae]TBV00819.1 inorganic triphosphatase [Stutzerimonas kirkiae]TBV08710.1 inorganic triphosphatase [Stutzerimonas kirkiae]TBV11506.1 inorganic triphosphatase [Stutzerimonas kirkiae]
MNKETEIKLRASRETLAALQEHPLLKKRNKSGWQRRELFNQYYDTPARELAEARVALRLRRDGEDYIQTLKSRGQSVAGLSSRNEWDWAVGKPRLDLKKLDDQCWPASLAALDKKSLKPIFSTDFVRHKADIAWGRGKARVVIEAALDLGEVKAQRQREEICELELELRQGEPEALLELAIELARDVPLMPCDISKAERGYRLFDAGSYAVTLPAATLQAETPLDDAFAALAWQLLGNSQRLAEQYRFNGHWKLLEEWLQQLVDLRALIGSLGQAAPRASSRELREGLDALLQDWRPLIEAGQQDESVRHAAPERFAEELGKTRWGLFSLSLSLWLLRRGWSVGRNAKGDRQGAVALANWLEHTLADEALALQLSRYQRQPEDLAEQTPRIERMLAWLRLARGVLDIPEADRLYGELGKLEALARQPLDEELRQSRVEHAIRVQSLKSWKALVKK